MKKVTWKWIGLLVMVTFVIVSMMITNSRILPTEIVSDVTDVFVDGQKEGEVAKVTVRYYARDNSYKITGVNEKAFTVNTDRLTIINTGFGKTRVEVVRVKGFREIFICELRMYINPELHLSKKT